MNDTKYIGMDVHQASVVIAVLDATGKLVMESIVETCAETILQFIRGLRGTLHVTFEEGVSADWLHDLLGPYVARVVVCDPRKNALLKSGNKNDQIDAHKLAGLLRAGLLTPVFHGESRGRLLRELAHSYQALTKDTTRVMNRLKALYRSRAIRCGGSQVYGQRHRQRWLEQLREAGVRRRAERLYQQLDLLQPLRRQARQEMVAEAGKHAAAARLRGIPFLGAVRVAVLLAIVETPFRFRTKRQFWSYIGLAIETRISGEYQLEGGRVQRTKKRVALRGLNPNHNRELKRLFKSMAVEASTRPGPWRDWVTAKVNPGMRPEMARLTLARKLAAITLAIWKKGSQYDHDEPLKWQAA
jgi:transposase